jgi:hypothetical protein
MVGPTVAIVVATAEAADVLLPAMAAVVIPRQVADLTAAVDRRMAEAVRMVAEAADMGDKTSLDSFPA